MTRVPKLRPPPLRTSRATVPSSEARSPSHVATTSSAEPPAGGQSTLHSSSWMPASRRSVNASRRTLRPSSIRSHSTRTDSSAPSGRPLIRNSTPASAVPPMRQIDEVVYSSRISMAAIVSTAAMREPPERPLSMP